MSRLDAQFIRGALAEQPSNRLDALELFGSIASTNTYLLTRPPPPPGRFAVALAEHQTSGRGRHSRRWVSPPLAGLNQSLAFTFESTPGGLPALTLAAGIAVVRALASLNIDSVSLKWPNDLVANDRKLGGILTETQSRGDDQITVVVGTGINVNLPANFDAGVQNEWSGRPIDLSAVSNGVPKLEQLSAAIINALVDVILQFESNGFASFTDEWAQLDWLAGKPIRVVDKDREVVGTASGVDATGRLLVATDNGEVSVLSGSVVLDDT